MTHGIQSTFRMIAIGVLSVLLLGVSISIGLTIIGIVSLLCLVGLAGSLLAPRDKMNHTYFVVAESPA